MTTTSNDKLLAHDESCMKVAIAESIKAYENKSMPFGACIADDETGEILMTAQNACPQAIQRGGDGSSDVTQHAEMELIRKMKDLPKTVDRSKCSIYTSTEPCVMCAGALYWSRVGRVVYGAQAKSLEEQFSGPGGFDVPVRELYAMGSPAMRKVDLVGPLLEAEALQAHSDSNCWAQCPGVLEQKIKKKDAEHQNGTTQSAFNEDIATERGLLASGLGAAPARRDGIQVPVIDVSSSRSAEEIADELFQAATTVGFFSVVNHGIPQEAIDSAFAASEQFFSQDQSSKESQSPFARDKNSGYEYFCQVRPSTGTVDQKESLQITARKGVMEGRWPSAPENMESIATTLLEQAHALAQKLLTLLQSKACPHLFDKYGPDFIAKSHNLWSDDGQCTLRCLHYPPMTKEELTKLTNPDEDGRIHWRAGPHTDWDNMTLLFQRPEQAGLECCANPRSDKDEKYWVPVDPVEGAIAVNMGDMLARWSNHALYSNLHRVRMPTPETCHKSRYSIAFFAQSDKSAVIESPNGDTITAGDYLLSRIQSNFAK
mmetsp:Transcript_13934/g.30456  ORF Transcript_13934/g.30456 Transcript_13934/m.30456 type:complete len:544 (+) Transcript_13934:160-1791(+)|eukprot:CAMPEP_0168792650 /NCGR_PEP_ID=MMETSP0725-20121227/14640_1 /TAXON_ID=265536 /ORGANISM="Amphiprora sp., Strain CCMP467" /LENGTH=543 /DNA_ID=CAMNT_0008843323 /DNA_START=149 /DNA_END=1780 /DNA_ORIENTATION=-